MSNRPLTLAEAAKHYSLTKGVLKAEGLRGRLVIYRLGKTYYTTHSAVIEWMESCRVEPEVRISISTKREASGKSVTERITFARDALQQILHAPKNS